MHILRIPEQITEPIPVSGGRHLDPGKSYLCTNAFTGEILQTPWRVVIDDRMWGLRALVTASPYDESLWNKLHLNQDWNGRDIWLVRGGGFGDLLMLTPLIMELQKKWPRTRIHVACGTKMHDLFDGLGIIPESLPIDLDDIQFAACVCFEDTIEGTPDAETTHIAQLLANKCGIQLESKKPFYQVTKEESFWALQTYRRATADALGTIPLKPRVALQFLASAMCRTYPKMMDVLIGLAKEAEVFLIGAPGQIQLKEPIPNVTNLMDDKLTFRQSAAVVSTCDIGVAPDSALVHLCSALDIPCIGLYGPFPAELRMSSQKLLAFQGKGPCAPCFFHASKFNQFPAGMPCTDKGKCVVLETIDSDDIIKETLRRAKLAN